MCYVDVYTLKVACLAVPDNEMGMYLRISMSTVKEKKTARVRQCAILSPCRLPPHTRVAQIKCGNNKCGPLCSTVQCIDVCVFANEFSFSEYDFDWRRRQWPRHNPLLCFLHSLEFFYSFLLRSVCIPRTNIFSNSQEKKTHTHTPKFSSLI